MTSDLAITMFRELAIGEKRACAVKYNGAVYLVVVPLIEYGNPAAGDELIWLERFAEKFAVDYFVSLENRQFVIGVKTDDLDVWWPENL